MTLDPVRIRACLPALTSPDVYLDNPGGTQVPNHVIDRMVDYLGTKNANHEGAFATSRASDALVDEARRAPAALFNAPQRLHVDRSVRGVMDGVDEGQGACLPGAGDDVGHRVDRAQRVGGVAAGDHLGARREESFELIEAQRPIFDVEVQPAHDAPAVFGHMQPG